MQPPVGLIPAAGIGSRLGAAGSKELIPVADPAGGEAEVRPVILTLLEAMKAAGIETAYVVIRRSKTDIPEQLAKRSEDTPRLDYITTGPTGSIPETLSRARPFVHGHEVLLGFPDIVFEPATAVADLLAARRGAADDVTLALFPSDRPDKTDMVELDGERVRGFRVKPGACELEHTWLLALWGDRFTDFLGGYLRRHGGQPPPGSRVDELQISQVLEAALAEGLSIGGRVFPEGRFIDVGTPEDLARAQGTTSTSGCGAAR